MSKFLAALAAVVLIGLTACAAPITHGTVTKKMYTPSHYVTHQVPQYREHCTTVVSRGKSRQSCHSDLVGYTPEHVYVPASYMLFVRNKKQSGWVSVTVFQYNHAHVGKNWRQ